MCVAGTRAADKRLGAPMKIPTSARHLDIADMRRRLGDDEALIADLLGLFLEDCAARMQAISAAVASGQLDAVRRGAHQLKGSAANLAAGGAVEAAGTLESMAERGEADAIDAQFARLTLEVEQLVAELRDQPAGRP
jgi:HPt (histidine-containing phosphotransfer) domain-containing protein